MSRYPFVIFIFAFVLTLCCHPTTAFTAQVQLIDGIQSIKIELTLDPSHISPGQKQLIFEQPFPSEQTMFEHHEVNPTSCTLSSSHSTIFSDPVCERSILVPFRYECVDTFQGSDVVTVTLVCPVNPQQPIPELRSIQLRATIINEIGTSLMTEMVITSPGFALLNNSGSSITPEQVHTMTIHISDLQPQVLSLLLNPFSTTSSEWDIHKEVPSLVPIINSIDIISDAGALPVEEYVTLVYKDIIMRISTEANTPYIITISYSFRLTSVEKIIMPLSWLHTWNIAPYSAITKTVYFVSEPSSASSFLTVEFHDRIGSGDDDGPVQFPITADTPWFALDLHTDVHHPERNGLVPNDQLWITFPSMFGVLSTICDLCSVVGETSEVLSPFSRSSIGLDNAFTATVPEMPANPNHFMNSRIIRVECTMKFGQGGYGLFSNVNMEKFFQPQVTIKHMGTFTHDGSTPYHFTIANSRVFQLHRHYPQFLMGRFIQRDTQRSTLHIVLSSSPDEPLTGARVNIVPPLLNGIRTPAPIIIVGCYQNRDDVPSSRAVQDLIGNRGVVDPLDLTEDSYYYTLSVPEQHSTYISIECDALSTIADTMPVTVTHVDVMIIPPENAATPPYTSLPLRTTASAVITNKRWPVSRTILLHSSTGASVDTITPDSRPFKLTLTAELSFVPPFYYLQGDHIVIQSPLFELFSSGLCLIKINVLDVTYVCPYNAVGRGTEYFHPKLGYHIACEIPPIHLPDSDNHSFSSPDDPVDSHFTPYLYEPPTTVFDLSCTFNLFNRGVSMPDEEMAVSVTLYPDQSHLPDDQQYTIQPAVFPVSPPMLQATVDVSGFPMWRCFVESSLPPDGSNRVITSCTNLPFECPDSLQTACGQSCVFASQCTVSGQVVDDLICKDEEIPKPYPEMIGLTTIPGRCPACNAPGFSYGPNCDTPPFLSPPTVIAVNGLPLHQTAGLITIRPQDGDDPMMIYDLEAYYDDILTLQWVYHGRADQDVAVYLASPSLTPLTSILIGFTSATTQSYNVRMASIISLRGTSAPLEDVTFSLVMGPYSSIPSDNGTDGSIFYTQVTARCIARTETLPMSFPSHMFSMADPESFPPGRCENGGRCNLETGLCECRDGSFGPFCNGEYHPDDPNDPDYPQNPCASLQCIAKNTHFNPRTGQGECTIGEAGEAEQGITCNCLPQYTGDQCQHERVCGHHNCMNGRLISPSGRPEECTCKCNNDFITGTICNQCALPCRNGGVVNPQCTECKCNAGYIGGLCQIPVWYHNFTLRNLPQHIVTMIIDASSSAVTKQKLDLLRQTLVQLLLNDYSNALRDVFILVDDDDHTGTNDPDSQHKVAVRVELSQFQTVIPPANPNAPYVYIQLMLYPADMTDEMLEYAQKHGLDLDWSRVTNNLNFFKQFLKNQGIIADDDNGNGSQLEPEIDDPSCLSRQCQENNDHDSDSSNGTSIVSPVLLYTTIPLFVLIAGMLSLHM